MSPNKQELEQLLEKQRRPPTPRSRHHHKRQGPGCVATIRMEWTKIYPSFITWKLVIQTLPQMSGTPNIIHVKDSILN